MDASFGGRARTVSLVAAGIIGVASFWPVGAGVRSQESMARLQLAVAFDANGQTEPAGEAFAEATTWYPENVFAWQRRLEWMARRHAPEEALALFEQVPAATRSTPELQYIHGILLERTGDLEGATLAYRDALDRSAGLPEAAARLAGLRARAGAYAEAESLLTLSTQSGSAPASAWIALAEVRLRLRDFTAAASAATAAVDVKPDDRRAARLLARCRIHLDDPAGARAALVAVGMSSEEVEETLSRLSEEARASERDAPIDSTKLPLRK